MIHAIKDTIVFFYLTEYDKLYPLLYKPQHDGKHCFNVSVNRRYEMCTTCGWVCEAADGSASPAGQEAVTDHLGLFEKLQVFLPILFRELKLWKLIFYQVNHITGAVWEKQ